MLKYTKILLAFTFIASVIFLIGCQDQQSVIAPEPGQDLSKETVLIIPDGATVVSAQLKLFQFVGNDKLNKIYNITAPWGETTVTWLNFNGAYDPNVVYGSFTPDPNDNDSEISIDVTNLVKGWADCSIENNGLLIDQDVMSDPTVVDDRSAFYSRENTNPNPGERAPYLLIELSTGEFIEVVAIADAYIWAKPANIDDNFGIGPFIQTGYLDGYEKQALIKFEIECTPPGCYQEETAWAANGTEPGSMRYVTRGNWATYLTYSGGTKTVNIYAGQTNYAGTATLSPHADGVEIAIELEDGWELQPMTSEGVKIQGYESTPPAKNPAPGKFTTYKGNSLTVVVDEFAFYGIHLDVRKEVDCE